MQYILNEDKINKGKQLSEEWRIKKLSLVEAYEKSKELINQGWYTVIHNPDSYKSEEYEIIVYGIA